jgi:hypothetical protein
LATTPDASTIRSPTSRKGPGRRERAVDCVRVVGAGLDVSRVYRACAAAVLWIAFAHAAAAAEPHEESQRWAPAFALFFDALGQKLEGAVTTGPVLGPPLPEGCNDATFGRRGELCASQRANPAQILFPDDEGDDTSVAPLVGASLELMTPTLFDGWVEPRLFVHGDGALAFSFERNVAGVEGPDEFALPPGIIAQPDDDPTVQKLEELSIVGQGSRSRIQVRRFVWSAGTGIAFTVEVLGRRVRVKPSLEYLHQEMDLIGVVHRAVKLRQPEVSIVDLRDFRLLSLTREEQRSYDGVGPGLELEVDTSRLGPFVSSIYLMGRGYHLFGDLDTTFSQINEFGETATWTFRPDSWVWRGGVGMRLRWLPEHD